MRPPLKGLGEHQGLRKRDIVLFQSEEIYGKVERIVPSNADKLIVTVDSAIV
jgi:hypothetical protein